MVSFSNEKDDPVVVNLSQRMEFEDNFHIGRFENREPRRGGGEVRDHFEWVPKDAVDRREAKRLQKSSVKPGNVLEFGPGTLSPRKIYWLLPDYPTELPDEVRQSDVGVWLERLHYQKQSVIRALEVTAEKEPQIMSKVRTAMSSELDDRVQKSVNKVLQQAENVSKARNADDER